MGSLDQLLPSTMPRRSPGPEELDGFVREAVFTSWNSTFSVSWPELRRGSGISKRNPEANKESQSF